MKTQKQKQLMEHEKLHSKFRKKYYDYDKKTKYYILKEIYKKSFDLKRFKKMDNKLQNGN